MSRKRFSSAEREAVFAKTGGRCAYCGTELTLRTMQVDHIIPVEFYDAYKCMGQDLNAMDNLFPACRSCNNYKHTLTLEKFRAAIEHTPDVLARDSVTYRNAVRFGLVTPTPGPVTFYFERLEVTNEHDAGRSDCIV